MIITHDHKITVFPNDGFTRRYVFLVKESCERKGYACNIKETDMYIQAQWQEAFVSGDGEHEQSGKR